MKNNEVRRSTIQTVVTPAISTALAAVPGLDLDREEDRRRTMRAVVHATVAILLEKGTNPHDLARACAEAISKEMEAYTSKHEGEGTFPQAGANA